MKLIYIIMLNIMIDEFMQKQKIIKNDICFNNFNNVHYIRKNNILYVIDFFNNNKHEWHYRTQNTSYVIIAKSTNEDYDKNIYKNFETEYKNLLIYDAHETYIKVNNNEKFWWENIKDMTIKMMCIINENKIKDFDVFINECQIKENNVKNKKKDKMYEKNNDDDEIFHYDKQHTTYINKTMLQEFSKIEYNQVLKILLSMVCPEKQNVGLNVNLFEWM